MLRLVLSRAFCTVLWACLCVARPAVAQPAVDTVSLDTPQIWHTEGKAYEDGKARLGSPIGLELARQAILIAARDELGLRTYDATLGEPTQAEGVLTLHLELDLIYGGDSHIRLSHGDQRVLDHRVRTLLHVHSKVEAGMLAHEAFSREQAVQALRDAGLAGEANRWQDSAPVPADIQELADRIGLIPQHGAARALHRLIREDGESPERLWLLSRVYANLGQESRWFLRCEYAAFQARSILYAQRLRAKAPDHVLGELSLAYAWVMAGYPNWAEANLGRAAAQLEENPDLMFGQIDPKTWHRVLLASVHYDNDELAAIMDEGGPAASVAALCSVMATEFVGMDALTFGAIEKATRVNPSSTRLYYGGYEEMGVSSGHRLTARAPEHFLAVSMSELARIADAPLPIAALAKMPRGREATARDLVEAAWALQDLPAAGGDAEELSYAVLGTLLDEANALHVLYRVKFLRDSLAWDTSDFFQRGDTLLDRHPYRPLIHTFAYPKSDERQAVLDLALSFEPTYLNTFHLATFTWQLDPSVRFANGWGRNQWWARALQMDYKANCEYLCRLEWNDSQGKAQIVRWMKLYDQHHPKRLALAVTHARLSVERLFWVADEYGQHAVVADALADKLEELGDVETALRFAQQAAGVLPERGIILRQARLELLLGDEDKWMELMQSTLELEDFGLDHAHTNRVIAFTLMNKGRHEEALPYAKASAGSGASWAMSGYAMNLIALGMEDQALSIARSIDRRYGAGYFHEARMRIWLGQIEQGPQALLNRMDADTDQAYQHDPAMARIIKLDHRISLGLFDQALEHATDAAPPDEMTSRELLQIATLSQLLGKEQLRDEYLQRLVDYREASGARPRFSLLAELLQRSIRDERMIWKLVEVWSQEHDHGPEGYEGPFYAGLFAMWIEGEQERAIRELLYLAKRGHYANLRCLGAKAVLLHFGMEAHEMTPDRFAPAHQWPE